jgi:hypothetical protein
MAIAGPSFLYIECEKVTNSSYEWKLPALEYNLVKGPFLLDLEFGEIYTAPRTNPMDLNHGLIYFNPNMGFKYGNIFGTASIGFRYYIAGNKWGIKEGIELFNDLRLGISWN